MKALAITVAAVGVLMLPINEAEARSPYHCPPGLANKGCIPPGQAKKRYQVGHRLPDGVYYQPVPVRVTDRLRPLPRGYVYGEVDGDILVIAEATRQVVEAVVAVDAALNRLD